MKYHPKHVEQLTDLNKLYSVESCWIIVAILDDARTIEYKKRKIVLVNYSHDLVFGIYLVFQNWVQYVEFFH